MKAKNRPLPSLKFLRAALEEELAHERATLSFPVCEAATQCPCPSVLDCSKLVYLASSSDLSKDVLSLVEQLYGPHAVMESYQPKLVARNKFWCPELELYMYQPCEVESCSFYSEDNAWTGNCILRYMSKHEQESLSYNELAFLMHTPTSELRAQIFSSIRKMRSAFLKEKLLEENSTNLFDRISNKKVCCVCEGPIKKAIAKRGYYYCSEFCLYKKPPKVLILEREFNVDFYDLVLRCVDQFSRNRTYIATALGISKSALEELCHQCSIPLPEE